MSRKLGRQDQTRTKRNREASEMKKKAESTPSGEDTEPPSGPPNPKIILFPQQALQSRLPGDRPDDNSSGPDPGPSAAWATGRRIASKN